MEELSAAIERVKRGESDAFRLIVEQHSRPLFKLAYRLMRNEHDADDVVQETFIRAYRHIDSFDGRSSFSTWLHRIAANAAFDLLHKRERDRGEELVETVGDESSDDALVLRLTVNDAVQRGMKEMTGNERTAFVLRHYEGMSIDEIGRVLGTESNATKNTIFRAVRKLREFLQPLVKTTCDI